MLITQLVTQMNEEEIQRYNSARVIYRHELDKPIDVNTFTPLSKLRPNKIEKKVSVHFAQYVQDCLIMVVSPINNLSQYDICAYQNGQCKFTIPIALQTAVSRYDEPFKIIPLVCQPGFAFFLQDGNEIKLFGLNGAHLKTITFHESVYDCLLFDDNDLITLSASGLSLYREHYHTLITQTQRTRLQFGLNEDEIIMYGYSENYEGDYDLVYNLKTETFKKGPVVRYTSYHQLWISRNLVSYIGIHPDHEYYDIVTVPVRDFDSNPLDEYGVYGKCGLTRFMHKSNQMSLVSGSYFFYPYLEHNEEWYDIEKVCLMDLQQVTEVGWGSCNLNPLNELQFDELEGFESIAFDRTHYQLAICTTNHIWLYNVKHTQSKIYSNKLCDIVIITL
jgi:hypothetical protein